MNKAIKAPQALRCASHLVLLATLAVLVACTADRKTYTIGVSQCSDDIWRDKQNAELRMGAYFHDNVELIFATAYDSDERQVQQIDSLVSKNIDLLIVAPNQVATISPAIDRAYDKGIPVIVFERKTSSEKHTAFISADNYEMGRTMGEYIASRLGGRGNVLEIKGLEGSSPSIERHHGFMAALKQSPGIRVVASLQGDWTEESAHQAVSKWLSQTETLPAVDYVFGHNDRMAMGARSAFNERRAPLPLFCGIDGLPGENGGIQLVRDSLLDASYIYPTHGDQLIDLAVRILDGQPYNKETMLMSALVTHENAKVLLMQSDEMMHQAERLDKLHEMADNYLHKLDSQRVINALAMGIIILLVVVIVLFYLYHLRKIALQREHVVNALWNMNHTPSATSVDEHTEEYATESADVNTPEPSLPTPPPSDITTSSSPDISTTPSPDNNNIPQTPDTSEGVAGTLFLSRFREAVEARLSDSDLSVEDLASDMNLSRVQLYRKVKAISGSSPVELLRTARLKRAYQLLLTTDKTVSEVAYSVGFSSPSYFTKCYKDEFGMLPGESRPS